MLDEKSEYFGKILTNGVYIRRLKLVFVFDGSTLSASFHFNGGLN